MAMKIAFFKFSRNFLSIASVEGTSFPLQSADDIHGSDGSPFCVLGVGDCFTNDVLKENLKNTTGLVVDESRHTFHSTATGKTTNSLFGSNTFNVITKNFSVTFGTTFLQYISSFAPSCHFDSVSLAFHGVDLHSTKTFCNCLTSNLLSLFL